MFTRLLKQITSALIVPVFATCLVTSTGCEEDDVDLDGGVELEEDGGIEED